MLIKNRIEVNYGYVGPSRDSQTGGPYYFEVMKPSYKFTAQNTFECSFVNTEAFYYRGRARTRPRLP